MVSEPLYTVIRSLTSVARTSRMICAGHGKYSYCHPLIGLNPSWFAVMAWLKLSCGIFFFLLFTIATVLTEPALGTDEPCGGTLVANVRDRLAPAAFFFFLKYIRPFGFRGDTNPTTLRYFLAKWCSRRTARDKARPFATFMRRLRTRRGELRQPPPLRFHMW